MNKRISSKRWAGTWLFAFAFIYGLSLVSCAEDDKLDEIITSQDNISNGNDDTPAEPDEIQALMATIPGIRNVNKEEGRNRSLEQETLYFFEYEQLIDHESPAKGTFRQHCCLHYVDTQAPVVLYTCGYTMNYDISNMRVTDLARHLKANTLEIEHRYFGESLPEPFENLDFNYLWTDQAAQDLHAIVSAVKQKMFTQQKWVSTGISKDGITTALYAYYSDKFGWNDIDLYVPFCAPFLPATTTTSDDIRVGEYLYNSCGSGYPATSTEGIAYERLRKIPTILLHNNVLRNACLRKFHQAAPNDYIEIINTFGRTEEQATCGVLSVFYNNLFDKFSYIPFNMWSEMVPDVDQITTPASTEDGISNQSVIVDQLSTFIFMSAKDVADSLERKKNEYNNYYVTRGVMNDEALLSYRQREPAMPYFVQAARELGNVAFDLSMIDESYVSKAQVENVFKLFYNATYMGKYASQWDQGKLMSDFRSWVQTQSKFPMIFIYSTNDPWTGGAIDDTTNPKVVKVLNPGGMHNDNIFSRLTYTQESCDKITQAINQYIGL